MQCCRTGRAKSFRHECLEDDHSQFFSLPLLKWHFQLFAFTIMPCLQSGWCFLIQQIGKKAGWNKYKVSALSCGEPFVLLQMFAL